MRRYRDTFERIMEPARLPDGTRPALAVTAPGLAPGDVPAGRRRTGGDGPGAEGRA